MSSLFESIGMSPVFFLVAATVLAFLASNDSWAQTATDPQSLGISEFTPVPNVNFRRTEVTRAKFSAVDVHTHFGLRTRHDPQQLGSFVELMNRNRIAICVSLDGTLGIRLDEHIKFLWSEHQDRFIIFANIDWKGSAVKTDAVHWACNEPEFVRRTCLELQSASEKGISGLKIFKSFGLEARHPDGSFVEVDDPRFDPIWRTCGELGLPVLIHTADPSAFFRPLTPENERYEELSRHPEWHYPPEKFPTREHLLSARERLFARHPGTRFIAAHFGNDAEDLEEASRLLNTYPNVVLDFASRISELGRQPYSARDFFIEHQDRILFATDGPWPEQRYHSYWRFLETRDEYFHYSEKPIPPQGLWRIYGIDLPDPILEKVYYQNAMRWVPGVKQRLIRLGVVAADSHEP